jgi:excisionase family DNA binding protein
MPQRGSQLQEREFFTIEAASEFLKCSTKTVRRMIANGGLRAYRLPGVRAIRIDSRDLEKALKPVRVYNPARELAGGDAQ